MNASVEKEFSFDWLKWLVVFALVAVGVVGNSHFSDQLLLVRVIALVVLGVIAAFVAVNTSKGSRFWSLLKQSQLEIRKVVWPTRQETTQTTLIVVAVVIVAAIILWLLDLLLGTAFESIIS